MAAPVPEETPAPAQPRPEPPSLSRRPAPLGRLLLRWGLRLLGPALLLYILWSNRDELHVAWEALRGVRWPPLIAAAVLVVPFVLLKGWRWQIILKDLGLAVPWKKLTFYYALGIFLGAAVPAQAGDFLKAWYLKEDGYDLGAALLSTVIDRLFDMLMMGLLALSGLYILLRLSSALSVILILVGMLGGICLVLSLLLSRRWRDWLIERVLRYLVPSTIRRVLRERNVRAYLDHFFLSWRNVALGTAISLVSFSTTFLRLWLLIPALGKSLPLEVFVPTMALMGLASLLSVAGLGTREAVLIAILGSPLLTAPEVWSRGEILSLSALILCIGLENLAVGLPLYLARPLGNRSA